MLIMLATAEDVVRLFLVMKSMNIPALARQHEAGRSAEYGQRYFRCDGGLCQNPIITESEGKTFVIGLENSTPENTKKAIVSSQKLPAPHRVLDI